MKYILSFLVGVVGVVLLDDTVLTIGILLLISSHSIWTYKP